MFPANFVTTDLADPAITESVNNNSTSKKSVQFNEEVKVNLLEKEPEYEPPRVVTIDPEKVDKLIALLHESDPTGERPDSEELISLEEEVAKMAPLIDEELQKCDIAISQLYSVNEKLVEAMRLYQSMTQQPMPQPLPQYQNQYPPSQ